MIFVFGMAILVFWVVKLPLPHKLALNKYVKLSGPIFKICFSISRLSKHVHEECSVSISSSAYVLSSIILLLKCPYFNCGINL